MNMSRVTKALAYMGCAALLLTFSSDVRASDVAYVLNPGGGFGTVNLNTAAHSPINFQICPLNGVGCYEGLGVSGGVLYTAADTTAGVNLYTVSVTGAGGTLDMSYAGADIVAFGSTTTGLFAVDTSGNLYSINSTTFAATLVGATGLSSLSADGLSTNSGTLYFTDAGDLYTLNTSTGEATLTGAMGSSSGVDGVGGMVYEDGTLYGTDAAGDSQSGEIFTINTSSGLATDTGENSPDIKVGAGLAPDPLLTPEPSSLLLLGSGLLGLMIIGRKRFSGIA
jgi:hypothetical protein